MYSQTTKKIIDEETYCGLKKISTNEYLMKQNITLHIIKN